MKELVLYIHGKNGCPEECRHYAPLFPGREVMGLDYRSFTPWEAGAELHTAVAALHHAYGHITLIANSIGAYFAMHAELDEMLQQAFFISPIVDMERLICDMMVWAGVSEEELQEKGEIPTGFGETLSWAYLCYVRTHPVRWRVPTHILYGGRDSLTSYETVSGFAKRHCASLTVVGDGEHWFHTKEQMEALDRWLRHCLLSSASGSGREPDCQSVLAPS